MICHDDKLAAMDLRLAAVTQQAIDRNPDQPWLSVLENSHWISARNACALGFDQRICVVNSYMKRISEIQARSKLVAYSGPVEYICGNGAAGKVSVYYFSTETPSALLVHGNDSAFIVFKTFSRMRGFPNEEVSFSASGNNATVQWRGDTLYCSSVKPL